MKKIFVFAASASAALFFMNSCSIEEEQCLYTPVVEETVEVQLTAEVDQMTKSVLGDYNAVCWEKGDQIMVNFNGYANQYEFTLLDEDAGKTTGRFIGNVSTSWMNQYGPLVAVYPSSACPGNNYSYYTQLTYPSTQTFRAGSFGAGANVSIAKTSDISSVLSFKNAGGLLRLTIKGSDKISKIKVTAKDALCGDLLVSKNMYEDPENEDNIPSVQTNGSNTVELDCGEGGVQLTQEGVDFYIFLPSGTCSGGFDIQVVNTAGDLLVKNAPASEKNGIKRNYVLKMPAFVFENAIPSGLVNLIEPGIYTGSQTSPVLKKSFISGTDQFVGKKTSTENLFSIQNWEKETVATYSMPSNLKAGEVYDVALSNEVGSSVTATVLHLKFIAEVNGIIWMSDTSTNEIYVFTIAG